MGHCAALSKKQSSTFLCGTLKSVLDLVDLEVAAEGGAAVATADHRAGGGGDGGGGVEEAGADGDVGFPDWKEVSTGADDEAAADDFPTEALPPELLHLESLDQPNVLPADDDDDCVATSAQCMCVKCVPCMVIASTSEEEFDGQPIRIENPKIGQQRAVPKVAAAKAKPKAAPKAAPKVAPKAEPAAKRTRYSAKASPPPDPVPEPSASSDEVTTLKGPFTVNTRRPNKEKKRVGEAYLLQASDGPGKRY